MSDQKDYIKHNRSRDLNDDTTEIEFMVSNFSLVKKSPLLSNKIIAATGVRSSITILYECPICSLEKNDRVRKKINLAVVIFIKF